MGHAMKLTARQELSVAFTALSVPQKTIGSMLGITTKTAQYHVSAACRRIGIACDTATITRTAIKLGIITL